MHTKQSTLPASAGSRTRLQTGFVLPPGVSSYRDLIDNYRRVKNRLASVPQPIKPLAPVVAKRVELPMQAVAYRPPAPLDLSPLPYAADVPPWLSFINVQTSFGAALQPDPDASPNLVINTKSGKRIERHLRQRDLAKAIARDVCQRHGVGHNDLIAHRRQVPLVRARQEVMFWLRTKTNWSLPEIGRFLGGRDHTTVLHGAEKHCAINNLPSPTDPCHGGPYVINE